MLALFTARGAGDAAKSPREAERRPAALRGTGPGTVRRVARSARAPTEDVTEPVHDTRRLDQFDGDRSTVRARGSFASKRRAKHASADVRLQAAKTEGLAIPPRSLLLGAHLALPRFNYRRLVVMPIQPPESVVRKS